MIFIDWCRDVMPVWTVNFEPMPWYILSLWIWTLPWARIFVKFQSSSVKLQRKSWLYLNNLLFQMTMPTNQYRICRAIQLILSLWRLIQILFPLMISLVILFPLYLFHHVFGIFYWNPLILSVCLLLLFILMVNTLLYSSFLLNEQLFPILF